MFTKVISIITVVYNAAETLEKTLQSVFNQSYKNIEYIIIDGGSTDGSQAILKKYQDNISTLIIERDEGIYDAMNKGLKYATGDWVFFLGADDLLVSPMIIEELSQKFDDPNSIYYGNTYLKNANRLHWGEIYLAKFLLCNISHQAIFYPKSVYKSKQYDTRYTLWADHVHNLELYAQNSSRFKYLPMLISIYNDMGRSSLNRDKIYDKEIISIIKKNFGIPLSFYVWLRRKVSFFKNSIIS